jgi:4-amino-4-deoxy-L-arabinose transferase-like glycosyltransferase
MRIARWLWSDDAPMWRLLVLAGLLLLVLLGARELWTHEDRWAAICLEMERSGDLLHPRLISLPYYDKPLLSYWVMLGLARLLGGVGEWALRLPSALAGLLAVWCTARLGRALSGRAAGLAAGTILVTCPLFLFWGRTSGSDMLNVAGTVAAVAWYAERRDRPGFATALVFGGILAVTCLMKGLIGAAIPVLVILPDLLREGRWRAHARWPAGVAALAAAALYLFPFALSREPGGAERADGLYQVFRENVVRYFAPFDHKGPPYLYLLFIPLYFLPWTLFLPAAALRATRRWRELPWTTCWPIVSSSIIFVVLTLSGSRRPYYLLPILPFLAVVVADWLAAARWGEGRRWRLAGVTAAVGVAVSAAWLFVVEPLGNGGADLHAMGAAVRAAAERTAPAGQWQVALCDAPSKAYFYLAPDARAVPVDPAKPDELRALLRGHPLTLVAVRTRSLDAVLPLFPHPEVIRMPEPDRWRRLAHARRDEELVVVLP